MKNFKVVISIAVVTALAFTSACDNANKVLTEPVATVTSVVGTDKNGDPSPRDSSLNMMEFMQ
ncbi:MAG: hypothetical protein IKE09_02270 [Clostridiales bacterium]|nr:hypothetical protein [Clostridiales bacterium]